MLRAARVQTGPEIGKGDVVTALLSCDWLFDKNSKNRSLMYEYILAVLHGSRFSQISMSR